jgi:hypothetical protein
MQECLPVSFGQPDGQSHIQARILSFYKMLEKTIPSGAWMACSINLLVGPLFWQRVAEQSKTKQTEAFHHCLIGIRLSVDHEGRSCCRQAPLHMT